MNDKAKIAALRAALEDVLKLPRGTSGRIILERGDEDRLRLALTADDAEQAPPDPCPQCEPGGVCKTPKCGRLRSSELMALYGIFATPAPIAAEPAPTPWDVRMQQHYAQGKSVQCHPAIHFMQQEIDDWRKK